MPLNGHLATTDLEKAETLNNFFCKVFTQEDLQNVPEISDRSKNQMEDIIFTLTKVKKLLKDLDTTKSAGADGMHPKVLNELSEILAEPLDLAVLFQTSFNKGTISQQWKSANITPLFKKGSKSDPSNYRHVSLTSIPCKLMEKLVREAVFNDLEDNNLLTAHQHGFVSFKSCVTNLLGVIDDWTETLNRGNQIDAVYLDFSKSFDSVLHVRLLQKI